MLPFFNPTLGGGGGNFTPLLVVTLPPCWFNVNNSDKVKAVALAFYSIQQHFIKNICAKFGNLNLPQSPDTAQNSDGAISDYWIYGQSFIKENCHNSRTSDDTDT